MRMGPHWNLRTRLTASNAALVAATLILSGVSLYAIRQVTTAFEDSVNVVARQMQLAASLQADFQRMRAASHASQISVVIDLLEKGSAREGQCSSCHDNGMLEKHKQIFHQSSGSVLDHVNRIERLSLGGNTRLLGSLREGVKEWTSPHFSQGV